MASATSIAGQPSLIEWQQYRFLLLESPKAANLPSYLREMKKYGVTDLVRVCEPLYSAEDVRAAGISMAEMPYEDGASPPQEVITKWLNLVQSRFGGVKATDQNKPCIAVHCVAGLGRCVVRSEEPRASVVIACLTQLLVVIIRHGLVTVAGRGVCGGIVPQRVVQGHHEYS